MLGIFAAALIVYLNSLGNAFHYDDYHSIVRNPFIRDAGNIFKFFLGPGMFSSSPGMVMYRPLLLVTYTLSYGLSEYEPWGWHVINILLHGFNACLFYVLMRRYFSKAVSGAAALVFAVHPFTAEPVNYISARSSLLVATFFLASFALYIRHLDTKKAGLLIVSVILFALSFLSKENGVTLAGVVLAHDLLIPREGRPGIKDRLDRKSVLRWALFFGLGIIFLAGRGGMGLDSIPHAHNSRTVWENLLTQTGVLNLYFKHFLWPVGFSNEYTISIARALVEEGRPFWTWPLVQGLIPVGLVVVALVAAKRRPLLSFGILWFFLTIGPEVVWPMNMVANDRRMYLPCLGFIMAAGYFMDSGMPRLGGLKKKVVWICVGVMVISFGVLTVQRNRAWSSPIKLWEDVIRKHPDSHRAYEGMGHHLDMAGYPEEAEWMFRAAIRVNPNYFRAHENLGVFLAKQKRFDEAIKELKKTLKIKEAMGKSGAYAYNTLGGIYIQKGKIGKAREALKKSIEANPNIPEAHYNLGLVYMKLGKPQRAIDYFKQAARLDPEFEKKVEQRVNQIKQSGESGK